MLIDRTGRLRFVHYGHSMSDIPSNEEILQLIETRLRQEEKAP
jgi:peroxiredoxin Q/BCP